ncbi:MAG: malonyl-CoA decarboxylase [Candidatus Eremiobacteraeota bacterium]|nr:malonyl-CoA decarboxylase [Candidatus Eremiobacteraeota bacterium]
MSAETNIFRRAVGGLATSWNEFVHRGDPLAIAPQPDLPPRDLARVRDAMLACVRDGGGDVTRRARAAGLGRAYLTLDATGKRRFFELLAEFDLERDFVRDALERTHDARDGDDFETAAHDLRDALVPPWLALLRQFNELPNGTKFLVDLRADLLEVEGLSPTLRRLERDLKHLLASWFDIGFLELRRITWDASATLLEKLARYEAVHEVRSWLDLKDRLDSDRRCFAYLHPAMPNEPLIFVEVALVGEISDKIAPLLDPKAPQGDPGQASVAIFYSISNCQKGLAGISFGNALIKRVVEALSSEFRNVRTFSTLSPIPGFRRWLDSPDSGSLALSDDLRAVMAKRGWQRDAALVGQTRGPLLRACAHYLLEAKGGDGGARDPVARFHLSNGARLERLNWQGDLSAKGLRDSAGLMVNYLYRSDEIDPNHEAYVTRGQIATSKNVRELLKPPR